MSMIFNEGSATAAEYEGFAGERAQEPEIPLPTADRTRWSSLEALPSPAAVIDAKGTVRWVNAAWKRALAERTEHHGEPVGISFAHACGRGMGFDHAAVESARESLRAVLHGSKSHHEFEAASHPRGGEGWFTVSLTPCALTGMQGALLQMVEITDVRQADRRRAVARVVARAMSRDDGRPEMLRDVINEVCTLMGWSLAARWSWNRASQSLRCEAVYSQRPDGSRGWGALTNAQGLASRVWASHAPQWSDGLDREDAAVARTVLNDRSEGLIEAVGVPVGRDGHPDGVVVFYSAHGHRPDAHFIETLSSLFVGGAWVSAKTSSRGDATRRSSSQRGATAAVVELASTSRCTLLITGERGTGKAFVAREIHASSDRARGPFIECDCTTLTPRDFDGVMFGFEAGSAPQTDRARRGLIEQAAGGTLVLRNIGSLDPSSQSKLLNLLETRAFLRVGGVKPATPDVRIVATSPYDLRGAAFRKSFSSDLLQRLSALVVSLPALRDRPTELVDLARSVLSDLAREYGRDAPALPAETESLLSAHTWPGNLRELRTVLERAWLGVGDSVSADAIIGARQSLEATAPRAIAAPAPAPRPAAAKPAPAEPPRVERPTPVQIAQQNPAMLLGALEPTALTLADVERAHIERVLVQMGFNMRRAATALDISRSTLYLRAKHYKINLCDARRGGHPGVENDNDSEMHDGEHEHDDVSATGT